MILELTLKEKGNITAFLLNKSFFKYVNYKEELPFLLKEIKSIKKADIYNGNINIITESCNIIIKNYRFNKNPKIQDIINKAVNFKMKERKKKIRKQKIKRTKAIAGVAIITIGIMSSNMVIKETKSYSNIEDILEEPIKQEKLIVLVNEETEIEKTIDKTINENENKEEYTNNANVPIEFNLDYYDRTNDIKYINAKNNYYKIIEEISSEYGIDPRIMLAIATQESGVHIIDMNRPAIGLMQIEKSVWNGANITAYNQKLGKRKTLNITTEKLKDLRFNIEVACMHFQNCLNNTNNNLLAAIQMYNYGYGNMRKVFEAYKNKKIEYLKNEVEIDDLNWLDYRNIISVGDSDYLEHILSYIEDKQNIICKNNTICNSYSIKEKVKNLTK